MAVSIFLKFQGPALSGESKVSGHENEMDVINWNWGIAQAGKMHLGTGGGAGKAEFHDIHVTKHVDKATPNLMQWCASGRQFDKATLTCLKASGPGGPPLVYVTIEMKSVIVSSFKVAGANGEDLFTEEVGLNFAEIRFKYTPQKDDGSGDSEVEAGWNIRTHKEAA